MKFHSRFLFSLLMGTALVALSYCSGNQAPPTPTTGNTQASAQGSNTTTTTNTTTNTAPTTTGDNTKNQTVPKGNGTMKHPYLPQSTSELMVGKKNSITGFKVCSTGTSHKNGTNTYNKSMFVNMAGANEDCPKDYKSAFTVVFNLRYLKTKGTVINPGMKVTNGIVTPYHDKRYPRLVAFQQLEMVNIK